MTSKPKRRQAGEGGISEYATKHGPRFLIKYPVLLQDGSKRVVLMDPRDPEDGDHRAADTARDGSPVAPHGPGDLCAVSLVLAA